MLWQPSSGSVKLTTECCCMRGWPGRCFRPSLLRCSELYRQGLSSGISRSAHVLSVAGLLGQKYAAGNTASGLAFVASGLLSPQITERHLWVFVLLFTRLGSVLETCCFLSPKNYVLNEDMLFLLLCSFAWERRNPSALFREDLNYPLFSRNLSISWKSDFSVRC